ncbi:hypothetical protein CHU93_03315 [Sandarakinorhabdus cyanobacteriorum]|uniref:Autotransporter domain-containing protein n=1 Tax=Sandarakinorhabdus cyanobacteriorum TaxID=1981098 RepID=A0A255YV59_9SPHN|nr:autotransporter outer membrane beta-barrel domain-containing protein [Sandarakinorhabdus cyanobacteriorum]OYQ33092.1 hypothetical protein CHU93_03315 [Sandarakinorhabdus cyanobacteriorum]
MSRQIMLAAVLLASASAATAQEGSAAQPADRERPWALSLLGGITAVQAQADQPFASLGIARNFGNSWVKGEVTYVGSGDARALTIPADTWIGGLSAGTYVGNLGLEGHVSLGTRKFDASSFRTQAGAPISVGRSGSLFGLGGSVSYDIAVGDRLFLTPYAGVDYSQIDFAVALTGPTGRPISSQSQSADGVTGSAGAALTWMFANDGGSFGLNAAFNTASNIAAVAQVGTGQRTAAGTPRFVDAPTTKGSWGELGATLSFNASKAVAIDLSVIQTVSFPFGDTTAGIAGVRFRF